MELTIPDPSLVVLVGTAGAGKTTFARRHFSPDEVLSSDAYRALVGRGEADQSVSPVAFAILYRELARRLGAGQLTVVDATNVRAGDRSRLLAVARRAGLPAVAVAFVVGPEIAHARNVARTERIVPPEVIDDQHVRLARSLRPGVLEGEGFAVVYRIGSAARDDVGVVRVPLNSWRPPATGG